MNIIYMIVCAVFVLGFLVLIHEAGHFLTARAFGVRVSEFMLGLPGPSIGFKKGGTRFGVTVIPLGGYARICGMSSGKLDPHLEAVMASVYKRGTATMEEVAEDCSITPDEAYDALEELVEWGTVEAPTRHDEFNTYRTPAFIPTRKQKKLAIKMGQAVPEKQEVGAPREIGNTREFFNREYRQQYRSLPFWKRTVILLAGVAMNLLFAMLAFIVVYSIIGFDYKIGDSGEIAHFSATPWQAIEAGFSYIAVTVQAILGLFNPATAAETMSQSASIVGIAVLSADFFSAGLSNALLFMGAISVSLGLMNLIPIPPLDGGRFVVEIFQKITRKGVPVRIMGWLSMAGVALFTVFFVIMLNQDIQRFIFGNW